MKLLEQFLLNLSTWSSLVPLVVGFACRRHLLWKYILVGFCADICFTVFFRGQPIRIPIAHGYIVIEAFFILSYFYRQQQASLAWGFWPAVALCLYGTIHIILQGNQRFDGLGAAYFHASYVLISIIALYYMLIDDTVPKPITWPHFWIIVGLVIYSVGNIAIFAVSNVLQKSDLRLLERLWSLNNALNAIQAFIFSRALWLLKRDRYGNRPLRSPRYNA